MLVSAVLLVGSVAASLGLLMTAQGPIRASKEAETLAAQAEARAKGLEECVVAAKALTKEVAVFRDVAAASQVFEEAEPAPSAGSPKPNPKVRPPVATDKAWSAAKNTHAAATRLLFCQESANAVATPHEVAKDGWGAVQTVKTIDAPSVGSPDQLSAAKRVLSAVDKAPLEAVVDHVTFAFETASADAVTLREAANGTLVRQPLPKGLLGREVAMFAGVLLSIVALLLSFFSLRARSIRREAALAPYRKAVRSPERGIQAATIIRLATEANGGEPGIVIGAAVLGLVAAFVGRVDADWYVVGVMLGVLLGVLGQLVTRNLGGVTKFRERVLALTELEKPAVPMVLVLSEVKAGSEQDFLSFFLKLSASEAALAVEKLATQAEEQILIAADAKR